MAEKTARVAPASPSAIVTARYFSASATRSIASARPPAARMAACFSPSAFVTAASRTPCASVTTARRVRSACIWWCIDDTTSGGGSMRWISTRTTRTPHLSVESSRMSRRCVLILALDVSASSRSRSPMRLRRFVCASFVTASSKLATLYINRLASVASWYTTAYTVTTTLSEVMTSCGGTSTTCSRMSTRWTRSTKGTMIRSPGSTVPLYRPRRSTTPRWYGRTILMHVNARTNNRKATMARTMIAAMAAPSRRPSAGCRRRARLGPAGRGSPGRDVDAPRADDETGAGHVGHEHGGAGGDAHTVGGLGLPRLTIDADHAGRVLAGGGPRLQAGGGAPLPPVGPAGVHLVPPLETTSERHEGGEADSGNGDEEQPLHDRPATGERRHRRRGGADRERQHEEEDGGEDLR